MPAAAMHDVLDATSDTHLGDRGTAVNDRAG